MILCIVMIDQDATNLVHTAATSLRDLMLGEPPQSPSPAQLTRPQPQPSPPQRQRTEIQTSRIPTSTKEYSSFDKKPEILHRKLFFVYSVTNRLVLVNYNCGIMNEMRSV